MGIIDANSAYHNPAKLHAIATRKNEIAIEGPAGGRPCMSAPAVLPVRRKFTIRSSACACRMEGAWKYSPAAAVPVSTKIPEPMMAPMPSAVSDHGPSVLLSRVSGFSDSEISLSMDLQQRSWLSEVWMTPAAGSGDDCDKSRCLLTAEVGHGRWPMPGTAHGSGERLTVSPDRVPAFSPCASSIRARNRGASSAFPLSSSCGRLAWFSCVLLWSASLYLP